jgi:hypothetical protein
MACCFNGPCDTLAAAHQRRAPPSPIPAALDPAVFDAYSFEIDSDAMRPSLSTGTETCGLMLRGKFSEYHPIARGISDRGGPHVV